MKVLSFLYLGFSLEPALMLGCDIFSIVLNVPLTSFATECSGVLHIWDSVERCIQDHNSAMVHGSSDRCRYVLCTTVCAPLQKCFSKQNGPKRPLVNALTSSGFMF